MVVVIMYKTKATACRALTFVVRVLVNDTAAIAVWTSFDTITIALWISFHLCVPGDCFFAPRVTPIVVCDIFPAD
jgi:hypothetical protein